MVPLVQAFPVIKTVCPFLTHRCFGVKEVIEYAGTADPVIHLPSDFFLFPCVEAHFQGYAKPWRNRLHDHPCPTCMQIFRHLCDGPAIGIDIDHAGRITKDQRRQMEYLAVSLVNTFMIAAIEGGVYPPDANAAADEALGRLSRIHDVSEITAIVRTTTLRLGEMVVSAVSQNSGNEHVEDAEHYISAHLTQEIRMEDVADAVGISLSHLSRLFREKTGMTMRCFLMQERIRAARHLLAAGDTGIPEIAALLRFCDQSHFTLVFRKETGETPARYRKKHRICAPEKI